MFARDQRKGSKTYCTGAGFNMFYNGEERKRNGGEVVLKECSRGEKSVG